MPRQKKPRKKTPLVRWVGFAKTRSTWVGRSDEYWYIVPKYRVKENEEDPSKQPESDGSFGDVQWVKVEGRATKTNGGAVGEPFVDTLEFHGWFDGRLAWRSTVSGRVYPFSDSDVMEMLRSVRCFVVCCWIAAFAGSAVAANGASSTTGRRCSREAAPGTSQHRLDPL